MIIQRPVAEILYKVLYNEKALTPSLGKHINKMNVKKRK